MKKITLIDELKAKLKILKQAYNIFKFGQILDTIVLLRNALSDNDIDYFKTLILQDIDENNNLNYSKGFLQMQINDTKFLIEHPPLWME